MLAQIGQWAYNHIMTDELKSTRLPIMVTPTEAQEIDDWRFKHRQRTRAEAIRQLVRTGLDLPLLCVDLLDAMEIANMLDDPRVEKELAAIETYLGTSRTFEQGTVIRRVVPNADERDPTTLTERESQIIQAVKTGKSNKEIAHRLNLTESTVKVHVRNVMRKIGATNRTEVAYKMYSGGLEDGPPLAGARYGSAQKVTVKEASANPATMTFEHRPRPNLKITRKK